MTQLDDFFYRPGVLNCIGNFDGEIIKTNNEWEKILGIKTKKIIGMGYLKYIHPDDQSNTMLTALHLSQGNTLSNFKNRFINKQGNYICINWHSSINPAKKLIFSTGIPVYEKDIDKELPLSDRSHLNQTFLDAIPSMVWATDEKGNFYYFNKSWVKFTGTSVEESVNSWREYFYEKDLKIFQEKLLLSTQKHKNLSLECRLFNRDRNLIWVNIQAQPQFSDHGDFIGMVGAANIIESIKIASNRLMQASQSASLGVWELDLKTHDVTWDKTMYDLYEFRKNKKITYLEWKNCIFPEDIKDVDKKLSLCTKTRTNQHLSFRIKTPKNNIKYIDAVFTVVADENNQPSKLIGINSDSSEKRHEDLFLHALHKIYIDKDTSITAKLRTILKISCEYFGLDVGIISNIKKDIYKVHLSYHVKGDKLDNLTFDLGETYCNETIKKKRLVKYANASKSKISTLPCYKKFQLKCYIGAPLHIDNKFHGTLCFASSDAKKEKFSGRQVSFFNLVVKTIEKELENEHNLRALTKKNEQLDSFAHIASHDLKEPLRSLNNYTQFLYADYENLLDDQGKKYISIIQWQAKYIKELIDDMLTYTQSSYHTNNNKEIELHRLILDLIKSITFSFPDKDVSIKLDNELRKIKFDERAITAIYRNLITNAIKYNDKKKILINIGSFFDKTKQKNIFYVKDNGIGIAKKFHQKIFELFKRLHGKKEYGGGTGLGLAIVKKNITENGGEIWLESSKKKGTAFFFYL